MGVLITPWSWDILSIPLKASRGISTETCGLDDVFRSDDLGSCPCTPFVIYIPYIITAILVIWINSFKRHHYRDALMGSLASQITSLTIALSIVYSGADQRKLQSSALLAFVWRNHRRPVSFPHKGPVTRKMLPFDDAIMYIQKVGVTMLVHWMIWYCYCSLFQVYISVV